MLGRLLVAPPPQRSEYWAETVIFIYEENYANTVGLIVNKPSNRTVKDLLKHHDLDYQGDDLLYIGGPVNGSALVMLHTDDWTCSNTLEVEGTGYSISSDNTMLKRICEGDQPQQWRMFLGMSAWTPQQLESELSGDFAGGRSSAWLTAAAREDILFGDSPNRAWNRAIDSAAEIMVQNYFQIN